jgi:hypothetical protein
MTEPGRRKFPRDAFSRIPPDARKLEPGMYATPDGTLYLDAAELCVAHGYLPTRANQEMIARYAKEQGQREGKPVLERERGR